MAQEMEDLEFLLPSELLTDDDLITDFACGFGSSRGLSSDLSSPVESVTGTTETGSDEDDFVSELTRKLNHSTLRNSNLSYDYPAKGLRLSGSPQSTLCGFKPGSRGSSNTDSRICSPPDAKDALSWDLLYAAAEEVARMRLAEETAAFYRTKPFPTAQKPNLPSGFYSSQAKTQTHISYQQLQAAKFQQMKQHQMMKNGLLGQGNVEYLLQNGRGNCVEGRAYGLSMSAWPTLQQSQQRTGSAMKTVFPVETGLTKERVGTGVFMPRRFCSNPPDTRKKSAYRAVHALNLNADSIDEHVQHRSFGNLNTDYDVLKHRDNVMSGYQKRNLKPQQLVNQEFRLPQEWTY